MSENKKMPVVFTGHGSPMLALEDSAITRNLHILGQRIISGFGRPQAILVISGHWYTNGTRVQSHPEPEQIYDMYGFPPALYDLKYPVRGSGALTAMLQDLLQDRVMIDDSWGIDHGTWSVLVHMFPDADIPVVQLSVDRNLSPAQSYAMGKKLGLLRKQGILILGSGGVVHNLSIMDFNKPDQATLQTIRFSRFITESLLEGTHENLIDFITHPDAAYAVPTPDHYYPLLYCAGAGINDPVTVFNDAAQFGSTSLISYVFGL